ncbi:MAG: GNAT family N-acyltransferase [Candidatus Cloacimonas sp.]|jgi:putative hemolysin|nr:GNAT family N-acyltransferase [Candidatus Cloacimonas sp.]
MPQFKQLTYIVKAFHFKRVNRLKNFSANIPIYIEKNNFIVKTADSPEELREALRLRHEVFISELLKRKKKSGLDKDKFDKTCDHLIIIDKRINAIIGTYRLQSSLHTKKYYTATEFHMRHIKRLPGNKLELGRACVHPEHRNGVTISLLWEGITAYIAASDSSYLFGCSSIKTMDRNEISQIYYYLKQCGYIADEHLVRPKGKFKVPGFKRHVRMHPNQLELIEHKLMRDKIPSLLSSYLKVGAKVCGIPALDRSFRCIDFLTLMNVEDIKMAKRRKDKAE